MGSGWLGGWDPRNHAYLVGINIWIIYGQYGIIERQRERYIYIYNIDTLVGGDWNMTFIFPHVGKNDAPMTNIFMYFSEG